MGSCIAFIGEEMGLISTYVWTMSTDVYRAVPLTLSYPVRELMLSDFSISPCMTRCSLSYSTCRLLGDTSDRKLTQETGIFDFDTGQRIRVLEGVILCRYASGSRVVLM